MSYLTDAEKRILFSALAREKEICRKLDNPTRDIKLVPIVESLERKFYYDRYENDIRERVIDELRKEGNT